MIYAVFFPFIAGIIVWLCFKNKTSEKDRNNLSNIMTGISVAELVMTLFLLFTLAPDTKEMFTGVGGLGIGFAYSGFRGIFGVLTAFAWFVTFLFAKEYMKSDEAAVRYDVFNMFTLGATMGVFYAADLFTVFFFFEIMSFTSFMWVAHRKTSEALEAAGVYLGIAIAGGLSILMGLFIVYNSFGTLVIGELSNSAIAYMESNKNMAPVFVAAVCMFAGFGAKASAFPLHVWLPKSYTLSPEPATALLSAVLSKTGVFGILLVTTEVLPYNATWGMFVLVIGVLTMLLGGIRGVTSNNFKTTIAYSSMSQIGFILVGAGMQGLLSELLAISSAEGGEHFVHINEAYNLAVSGTMLHMVNHSIVKLILFMIAGIVFINAGSLELNKVRGFGHKKPFLMVTFILAAAGVGGIPFLNGYVSKTLLHESIVEYAEFIGGEFAFLNYSHMLIKGIEYLFLFSGGLTVAYMIKLFVALFIQKNSSEKLQQEYESKKSYATVFTKAAIGLCAIIIPIIGIVPNLTADKIAKYGYSIKAPLAEYIDEAVHYFSLTNLMGALISIITGVVVYMLIVRIVILRNGKRGYADMFPKWMDMERFVYKAFLYKALTFALCIISRILDSIVDIFIVFLRKTVYRERAIPYELPEGNYFTHKIGGFMEKVYEMYCGFTKKEYIKKNYEHKAALKNTDAFESFRIIERSLSFGLFMFCVGLGLTMIYLLVVN